MKLKMPTFRRKPAPMRKRPPKLKLKASAARSRAAVIDDDDDDYYDEPEPNMKLSHAMVVVLVLHVIAVAGVFAFNSIKSRQAGASESAPVAASTTEPANATASGDAASASLPAAADPVPAGPRELTAPPVSAAVARAAESGGKTHEVRPGETLTRISTIHGVSIAAIQEANGIDDPTKIRAGEVLVIPGSNAADSSSTAAGSTSPVASAPAAAALTAIPTPSATDTATRQSPPPVPVKAAEPVAAKATAATPKAAPASTGSVKDSGEIYEVVAGDNPVSIARSLGVSYNDLMSLNQIEDPRLLQIGQKLKIPAK